MGKAISNDTSSIIVRALAQGHARNDIAKMCGVSTRAVTRVSTNLKKHGSARPPPSGLKQGRPAKLTRKQAEALLVWITARDYAFYVKDLTKYLKENHGYVGCDGTVRRGMVRAGFKRKEPYHKSEITVWIPPEHPPQFEVIAEDEAQAESKPISNAVVQPAPVTMAPEERARSSSHDQPEIAASQRPDDSGVLSSYPEYYQQGHAAFQSHPPLHHLDPSLYDVHPGQPTQQAQQTQKPPESSLLPINYQLPPSESVSKQPRVTKSPSKKAKKPKKEEALQSQVACMHEEMAKQAEMIRQLQSQLAQSQGQGQGESQPSAPMPQMQSGHRSPEPLLELHSQGLDQDYEMHEEEIAV